MNLLICAENHRDNFYPIFLDDLNVGEADEWSSEGEKYNAYFDLTFIELSSHSTIKEVFLHNICAFSFEINTTKYPSLKWVSPESSIWFNNDLICSVNITPDFLGWDNSISLSHVIDQLKLLVEVESKYGEDILEEGLLVLFKFNGNNNIESEYSRILALMNNECAKIFSNPNNKKDSLFKTFNFPPEIRVACEQYLIYFSQFLEDVGIEVTLEINSQINNTYFTIIPNNPEEALSNIKTLLDLYLSLPQATDIEIAELKYSDVSVSQLISNIYHLKSQLQLAQAVIQAKDATILSLNFVNYQRETTQINSPVVNEEKVVDGLITVTEYEAKGFKINLPEIIRRMKRTFKK